MNKVIAAKISCPFLNAYCATDGCAMWEKEETKPIEVEAKTKEEAIAMAKKIGAEEYGYCCVKQAGIKPKILVKDTHAHPVDASLKV